MYEQVEDTSSASKDFRLGVRLIFISNKCVFCNEWLVWIDRVHAVEAFETVSILATVENETYFWIYIYTTLTDFYLTN